MEKPPPVMGPERQPGKYEDFKAECLALWEEMIAIDWGGILHLEPRGILGFIKIVGCLSKGWRRCVCKMDLIAYNLCLEEDNLTVAVEPLPLNEEVAVNADYKNFTIQLYAMMIRWAGRKWDEPVQPALWSLRYLNRCLIRKNVYSKRFELAVLSIVLPTGDNEESTESGEEEEGEEEELVASPELQCCVCHKTVNVQQCVRCKAVYYCSVVCQKKDWRSGHKTQCKEKK